MSRRIIVQAAEVTLTGTGDNLSSARQVRVLNDTAASILLTIDDAAQAAARTDYNTLGSRSITIAAGEEIFLEKEPLEIISGAGLKATPVARQ